MDGSNKLEQTQMRNIPTNNKGRIVFFDEETEVPSRLRCTRTMFVYCMDVTVYEREGIAIAYFSGVGLEW